MKIMNYFRDNNAAILLVLICFSCSSHHNQQLDTTETNPNIANWEILSTNSPSMQSEYAMAYNVVHEKIIAYGGRTGFPDFNNINETWAFDYKQNIWTNLEPIKSPPWRTSHTMVYDSMRNKVLMFGGNDFNRAFNDLWEYDYNLNTWTELFSNNPPEARQMQGLVYVPDQDIIFLFGGRRSDGGAVFNDTWKYDAQTNEWEELNPNNSPPVQDHVALAYDSANQKVIMYADNEDNNSPATWAYDFIDNNWSNLNSRNIPSADHCKLVYDEQNNKSIMFSRTSTWMFHYTENSWTNITPDDFPTELIIEHDGMVYINNHNVFIQYGGCCSNQTLRLVLDK